MAKFKPGTLITVVYQSEQGDRFAYKFRWAANPTFDVGMPIHMALVPQNPSEIARTVVYHLVGGPFRTPGYAWYLASLTVGYADFEAMIGDLDELFVRNYVEQGPVRAHWFYFSQILRSIFAAVGSVGDRVADWAEKFGKG